MVKILPQIYCVPPPFGSAAERSASSTSTSSATSSIANEEYTDTRTIMPRAVAVAISRLLVLSDFFDLDFEDNFIRKSYKDTSSYLKRTTLSQNKTKPYHFEHIKKLLFTRVLIYP